MGWTFLWVLYGLVMLQAGAVCTLAVGFFGVGQWHLDPNLWGLGEG